MNLLNEILNLVKAQEKWRGKQCLNLIPSENIMSPAARSLLCSDFAHRYTARDRFYMGTRFADELEQFGEKIAKKVFKAEVADLRPLSGHIADWIMLTYLAERGDRFMCVSPEDGGYPGMWQNGLAGVLKLKIAAFPFSKKDMNVLVEQAKEVIHKFRPSFLIFGASLITFPQAVKELAGAACGVDALVGYDGSHVLGLIAGGQFQDPLREGAFALFGSTHKSFFGPQGGIILADREHGEVIKARICPAFVDNAHWNRIAALTLALAEMEKFGKAYASQVIKNAKALAEALYECGFPVRCAHRGFTQSHQAILDYGSYDQGRVVAERLQQADIIVDCAVRVGTCEVTRRGMKEAEMSQIAELMKRAVIDKEPSNRVKKDVAKLTCEFQNAEYCFA
ncbi:hypothetical protein KEJ15_02065 [Candidatus Bathyarchaeota archaeon]|nr:hypothetical protein [Candidatus Bathyarchaeota archaeon]